MNMIGLNIQANFVKDRAKLLSRIEALRPASIVVMDDLAFAERLAATYPEMSVIHRRYYDNELEKRLHEVMYAHEIVETFPPGRVIHQLYNEPPATPERLPALVSWSIEVMRRATDRGVRLCLPNFAVGNPYEGAEIDVLRPLLDEMTTHKHKLGMHEYFVANPIAEPWHIGRAKALINRTALNIETVMTEYGRDVGGGENDGWALAFDQSTYADLLIKGVRIYQTLGRQISTCIYCYGSNHRWRNFDIEGADDLFRILIERKAETQMIGSNSPIPVPDDNPNAPSIPARVTSTWAINIRAAASISAKVIGTLRKDDLIYISDNPIKAQGYDWYEIRGGIPAFTGYVAGSVLSFEKLSASGTPTDSALRSAMTEHVTSLDDALTEHVQAIGEILTDIRRLL